MIKGDLLVKREEFDRLREKLIIPAIKNIVHELEQKGWCCAIGELNPFKVGSSLDSSANPELKPSCMTSLLIADIENRLVQYVYVFVLDKNIRVVGDENCRVKNVSLELSVAQEVLEAEIRKVVDLGI